MSYYGTTASSSLVNPPRLLISAPHGQLPNSTGASTTQNTQRQQGGSLWYYSSTNKTTDVFVSNFFSDGKKLGMKPLDIVLMTQFTSAGSSVVTMIGTVTGVSTSGATLASGAQITSTYS
jgi:hypothetical protein